MTERLNIIFNEIPDCQTFADIGCDHGYIANAMIRSGKAKRVIISDISAKCLLKAEQLLEEFIKDGRACSVVSNGFEKIDFCDVALIAGMGGEEICDIIEKAKALPEKLVLQPMKNPDKVRVMVVKKGYKIQKDYIFKSANKFYDLMILQKGEDVLNPEEIEFGRDNVRDKGEHFKEFLAQKISRINGYLQCENLSQEDKQTMLENKEKLEKYV